MMSSIQIEGYRGFERFEMSDLGRINLLVGTNNSGKTSVLEAIYLLSSGGDALALWQLLWRRGERIAQTAMVPERPIPRRQIELDVAHLFHGHDAQPGARLRITATNQSPERVVEYSIIEVPRDQEILPGVEDDSPIPRLALALGGVPRPAFPMIALSRAGGIYADAIDVPARRSRPKSDAPPSFFITTDSLSGDELVSMWNRIALTPLEGLVVQALQFLDPDIERIAAQAVTLSAQTRGGFIVKRKGSDMPVPIGSMGDGMWRMLAMAMSITQCKGGVLLVDEIDTGLHYTVMSQMWKLIFSAAREFDVQVFATTHSFDCVYALAQICSEGHGSEEVTVQRIEPAKHKAVPYDEDEISVAARREIEVR